MNKPADPDWNDLRYALAAVRAGSLAGAARALGVEHSTIGRRLTALEEALGAPLLTRGPGGLGLTEAGARAVPLLEAMERAALALRDVARAQSARVRLATPSAFGRLLAPHLGTFQAARPDLTLEVVSGSRPVDLKRGEADVALRVGALDDDGELVAKKVGVLAWSLFASKAYLARRPAPADPRELAGHDVLGFEASLSKVPGARWLEQYGAGARVAMRCREVSDLIDACGAGIGVAVLPCFFAALEPAIERLTPERLGVSRLSLVYRKDAAGEGPARAVIEFVSGVLQQHAGELAG